MGIGFSFPANYSKDQITKLKDILNKKNGTNYADYIADIYGSLPYSFIGHSRFPKDVPNISIDKLEWYISELHKIKIPFYFVMNNPWSQARERLKVGRALIFKELRSLIDIGIDGVILANPYLIKLIHKNFPELTITTSTNLQISSYIQIKNYIDFGVDYVVLGRDINRNFKLLKKLFKDFSNNLILLANTSCLLFCPLTLYHPLITGHISTLKLNSDIKSNKVSEDEIIDEGFCFNYCMDKITTQPESILKSPWIRPEDVIHYEKIGLKFLKIQGRTMKVDDQISLLKGYLKRRTPNDDLFFLWPNFRNRLIKFVQKNPSPERKDYNFQIRNSDLKKNGFFKFFLTSNRDCRKGCAECQHCETVFKKILI